MTGLIDRFVEWGRQLVDAIGYVGLSVIMFLENVFPPVPSEPFLLGAGFSSGQGGLSPIGAVVAATVGALLGATVYYYIGVLLPERRIRWLLRRYGRFALLDEHDLDRAMAWFGDHGPLVVFFGRCLPLVRTLISVPAGLTRMHLGRFLLYSALGTAAWSALLIGIGRVLGENWESALAFFDRFELAFYAVALLAIVAFVIVRLRTRRRRRHQQVGQPREEQAHERAAGTPVEADRRGE
jgi:membrane protein DedA with SNARE-associated domain